MGAGRTLVGCAKFISRSHHTIFTFLPSVIVLTAVQIVPEL